MSERERARLVAWAQEMYQVHQRLRSALRAARDSLDDNSSAAPTRELLMHCRSFCRALDRHHRGEDTVLFPVIRATHPNLASTLDRLTEDHSMIATLVEGLDRAVRHREQPATLERHLAGLAAIMENHFRYEERQLTWILEELELDVEVRVALGTA